MIQVHWEVQDVTGALSVDTSGNLSLSRSQNDVKMKMRLTRFIERDNGSD